MEAQDKERNGTFHGLGVNPRETIVPATKYLFVFKPSNVS